MIMYIERNFIVTIDSSNEEILKNFDIEYKDDVIQEQKVVLDEFDMNTFYNEFFLDQDVKMEYGFYGGEGCDFSIMIS